MHVNDSKTPFDSHRDRHENIGRGSIPMEAFRWIMNNPKFQVSSASGQSSLLENKGNQGEE